MPYRNSSILRWLVRVRPVVWRALICWILGCVLLMNDEASNLDVRYRIRGDQPVSSEIVIIKIHPDEIIKGERPRGRMSGWKDVVDMTDSFYWDPQIWRQLFQEILVQSPRSVGVTMFLNSNLNKSSLTEQDLRVFQDPRVIWAAPPAGGDRGILPLFYDPTGRHLGSYELQRDEDGVIRRFSSGFYPHLVEQMTGKILQDSQSRLINYRGGNHIWPEYSLSEVIDGTLSPETFKGKYVLIGAEPNTNSLYQTPFGSAYRASVMAQIMDNLLADRFVKRAPTSLFVFMLFLLLALCVFLLIQYPGTVAAVFMIWVFTFIAAMSIWIFDTFSVWTPVFAPAVQMIATWVVFLGYQANRFERKNAELKQEQKNLQELEQLKNNFVSLISHDLKTPIAKSQAVVDRLMTEKLTPQLLSDLQLLRTFNDELHRYIQSILKLLRVESRNFELTLECGDVNETIESVVNQVKPLMAQKNLALELSLEPLFTFEGDFTLIREVFLNLIENAVKYTPTGGTIGVKSYEDENDVVVEVSDTGPGIPKEEIDSVWRKFVRGKGQEHSTSGTGLGLYLVKYFIELHGGTVHLESQMGKGTRAVVRLPLEGSSVSTSNKEDLELSTQAGKLSGVTNG